MRGREEGRIHRRLLGGAARIVLLLSAEAVVCPAPPTAASLNALLIRFVGDVEAARRFRFRGDGLLHPPNTACRGGGA